MFLSSGQHDEENEENLEQASGSSRPNSFRFLITGVLLGVFTLAMLVTGFLCLGILWARC